MVPMPLVVVMALISARVCYVFYMTHAAQTIEGRQLFPRQLMLGFVIGVVVLTSALLIGCGQTVSRTVDDAGVSTRVKTALLNDPVVAATSINVAAQAGVVTLSGTVRSDAERERAVAVARQTAGVTEVNSAIEVVPPK
jgi:hyperosmotically inducible protein